MSEDWRVKGRADEEVRRIANRTKADYKVTRIRPVNILRCLQRESVETLYGRKKLIFSVVDDEELGIADAKTEFSGDAVTITCKRTVQEGALFGAPRDRMTLAHELGHAVMHSGAPKYRYSGASGTTSLSEATPYESAEHQAKVFASAFLIHDEDAIKMADAQEIAEEFGVSLQAALICFERLKKKAERARSAERIMKMSQELKAKLLGNSKPQKCEYLADICTACHQQTLVPRDNNQVSCDTCGFKGHRFQDGDQGA